MNAPIRTARLEVRVTPQMQEEVKRCAELTGRSLTDYIVTSLSETNRRIMAENEMIRLSREDQIAFAKALIEPREPTDALKRAARRHQDLFGR